MPFHHHKLLKKVGHKIGRVSKKVVKKIDKKLKSRPKAYKKFMKHKSKWEIVEIQICRQPIKEAIKKALDLITGGKVTEIQEKYNYDEIFHLYALIRFSNGKEYLIEKNQIPILRRSKKSDRGVGECQLRKVDNIKFSDAIKRAEKHPKFYFYSSQKYNCQDFLTRIAHELDITDLDEFINQYEAKEILSNKGVRKAASGLTTIANAFDRYILGK